MGLARAVCACDHPGCEAHVDLRVDPASEEDAPDLLEVARAIAEQRGWACGVPGTPREKIVPAVPGYAEPTIRAQGEGRDLCPAHRPPQ